MAKMNAETLDQITRLTERVIALEAVTAALLTHVMAGEEAGELLALCETSERLVIANLDGKDLPWLPDGEDLPWLPDGEEDEPASVLRTRQMFLVAMDLHLG